MEVAPSAVGIGESIGIGKTLTAGILPPYDFTRLSFARKTDGSDRTSKAGLADRPAPIERKVDTLEMRNSFVKTKETSGEWTKLHKKVDGRPT
ncbi:MAG: hypothetical protein LBJ75_03325, partial [Puniceicoccales bacterium]|nr:hypothetical protein [Puniceicoccales bacterium]